MCVSVQDGMGAAGLWLDWTAWTVSGGLSQYIGFAHSSCLKGSDILNSTQISSVFDGLVSGYSLNNGECKLSQLQNPGLFESWMCILRLYHLLVTHTLTSLPSTSLIDPYTSICFVIEANFCSLTPILAIPIRTIARAPISTLNHRT